MKEMWLSKYALTGGVVKIEGEVCRTDSSYFVRYPTRQFLTIGRDCFPTEREALSAAEAMRVRKIASLKKQIAKLEKLEF